MNAWLFIIAGFVVLTLGADILLRGATAIARRLRLSELLIGLTLVGFGTSTPELVSSVEAARTGAPGIALGNVIGSNIANILFILGLSALIAPVAADPKAFRRDAPALALATLAAVLIAMTGAFGRMAGGLFLLSLAGYIAFAFLTERQGGAEAARHEEAAQAHGPGVLASLAFAVIGLALLMGGAKLLVGGAVNVAERLGVSDALIGLTIVAVGTSLPELVASAMAALRGKSDLALGNVIGSNLYNLLGILGATALISPFGVDPQFMKFDIWVMLAATAGLIVFARTSYVVNRIEGALMLAAYGGYISWLVVTA